MLKAKNILIIFMLNYLLILFACGFIEIILIGSTAQEAQNLMRTAADMALEQVQATDDFFVSGPYGYILNSSNTLKNNNAYSMKVLNNAETQYIPINLFEAVTGQHDYDSIYNSVYGGTRMYDFIKEKPNVLNIGFIAGNTKMQSSDDDIGDLDYLTGFKLIQSWYQVPTIAQMGSSLVGTQAKKMYLLGTTGFNTPSTIIDNGSELDEVWELYNLNSCKKETWVDGVKTHYYYTPLSLGITYINEDLLQAFFMNNLDLLMRSKYTNRKVYNLTDEKCGYGVLKTAFYPELTDTDSLNQYNPINNGSFTLLRGEKLATTDGRVSMYMGMKPKIEYKVIDMYATDPETTNILQAVFGAKFSSKFQEVVDNGQIQWLTTGFEGELINGETLKKTNEKSIEAIKHITNSSSDILDTKPIVIAKVTFYADFIIPYKSVSLREMRGREINGKIGSRSIFSAFDDSQLNNGHVSAISGNYVDIENTTDPTGLDLNKIYNDGKTRLAGNGDALTYTTYFAVTP